MDSFKKDNKYFVVGKWNFVLPARLIFSDIYSSQIYSFSTPHVIIIIIIHTILETIVEMFHCFERPIILVAADRYCFGFDRR